MEGAANICDPIRWLPDQCGTGHVARQHSSVHSCEPAMRLQPRFQRVLKSYPDLEGLWIYGVTVLNVSSTVKRRHD